MATRLACKLSFVHFATMTKPMISIDHPAAWGRLRYGLALVTSSLIALFVIGGLMMGGPEGVIGWTAPLFCLALPALVWWTRNHAVAPLVQSLPLILAAAAICMIALTRFSEAG